MNWNSLLSRFSFWTSGNVKRGIKVGSSTHLREPLHLESFPNPLELRGDPENIQAMINKFTTKDFYKGIGAELSTYMIDNVPAIASCVESITSSIAEADWKLEGDHIPKKTMALFQELLDNIEFTSKIRDIVSFIPYGWSAFEIVFGRPEKGLQFPIKSLVTIRQETLEDWVGDNNFKVIGLKQVNREKAIPVQKLVLFRDSPNRGCVEGRGMLRSCFSAFKALESLKKIHLNKRACSASNFVKGFVPDAILAQASRDDTAESTINAKKGIAALRELLNSLSQGHSAAYVMPSDVQTLLVDGAEKMTNAKQYDIEVQPLGLNEDTILEDIRYYTNDIIMGMQMESRLVGSGETGSKSSGEVHKSTAETFIASQCKTVSWALESQLFKRFAVLNGIKLEHIPKLVATDIDKSNINFKINASTAVINASEKGFPEIARDIARDAKLPEDDIKDVDEMNLEDESLAIEQPPLQPPDLNLQLPGQQIQQK